MWPTDPPELDEPTNDLGHALGRCNCPDCMPEEPPDPNAARDAAQHEGASR